MHPLVFMHKSWKYGPISIKISDNAAEGIPNLNPYRPN